MDYSAKASEIRSKLDYYVQISTKYSGLLESLDGAWNSPAGDNIKKKIAELNNTITSNKEIIEKYCSALDKMQKYVELCNRIGSLQATINNNNNSDSESSNNALLSQLNYLLGEKENLKREIIGILDSLGFGTLLVSTSGQFILSNELEGYIREISSEYDNAPRNTYKSITSAAQYEEVTGKSVEQLRKELEYIKANYQGREAVVRTAISLYGPLVSSGYRLKYKHNGSSTSIPYTSLDQVINGVDCNPMASFLVDKGAPNGFTWAPVYDFCNMGCPRIDDSNWGSAQPGDIITDSSQGHVMTIVGNYPNGDETDTNPYFIIAHASSDAPESGSYVKKVYYSNIHGSNVYDFTQVYEGKTTTWLENRKNLFENVYHASTDRNSYPL